MEPRGRERSIDDMGEPQDDLRRLMSSREVAEYCRVGPETVRRWIRAGKLKPTGQVPGGHYLFDIVAVNAFLGIAPVAIERPTGQEGRSAAPAPAPTLSREQADRMVDLAYENVMRQSLKGRGMTEAEIDKEFARRRRNREATRRAMNDPDVKRRVREGVARYWADPENRRKHAEAMRQRRAARTDGDPDR